VKRYHEHSILKDCYILCDILFPYLFNANTPDHVGDVSLESRLYSAVTGLEMDVAESYNIGSMICTLERALAARDGRTRQDDLLHDLYFEKEDAGGRKYNRADLEKAKTEYYQLMGWDLTKGIPTKATLQHWRLPEVAEGLQKYGRL